MKTYLLLPFLALLIFTAPARSQTARMLPEVTPAGKGKVNTKVDNIGYWLKMVQLGYVKPTPHHVAAKARFTGTGIRMYTPSGTTPLVPLILDSPDVAVSPESDVTQSENSLFIDPSDENIILNSNNSSSWISGYAQNPYGADALYSDDGGQSWDGSPQGVNGSNGGDPSTAIGPNGWWYVGRISGDYGQAVSYSKDHGATWKRVKVGEGPTAGLGALDKNHLWVDNSPSSPFLGYLYDAWTNFIPGHSDTNEVQIVRSADHGLTWSAPYNISEGAAALKLNHGVNLQTGPNGELYVAWSIYDTWPSDETAIGFTRSFDGGGTFAPATRIISNIKGIRASMTGKNMRVNSFPSMAVDNSAGPNRGTVYLVWANAGYPGVNTGTDIDVYMIRSANSGTTWSAPIRVNQDPSGLGKEHYFPFITCDRVTGGLCVVYYDDRDVDSTQAAVYVSVSYDGGNSWSDMQVSDVTFTPEPIPGMAFSYFGDYIGVQSENMKVCPVWTDNRDGRAMSYVSPFDLGPNPNQAWITWYSDSLATVSGTGNVTMNYGDSLHLSLGLKNIGDQPASSITAVVSSPSSYVIITDSIADYGQMNAGEVKTVPDGYTFKVSDTIPDNLMVRFNVRVSNPDSTWYSHFSREAHAPSLRINSLTIYDTVVGNFNGRMDPGETVKMVIPVANTGDFDCPATRCLLSTTSPFLNITTDSVFLDTIGARKVKTALFTAVVSPSAPIGIGCDLFATTRSGLYGAQRTFRRMVGQLVEDWESNSMTKFPWQVGGAKPWMISTTNPWEGTYCSSSGVITDYQNSQLIISYATSLPDSISFYLRTSSEQDYDYLMFLIDGVLQEQWSGETPWTRAIFAVAAGQHTFKWIYLKDLAFSSGLDRAWVDFIAFPPPVLPVVDPGADDTICTGVSALLNGTAHQYDTIRWSTLGDGSFLSDTSLITTYTPGPTDRSAGQATLVLTAQSPYGSAAEAKNILIHPQPDPDIAVTPNDTVCNGHTIYLSASGPGISSWQWLPGNITTPDTDYDTLNAGGTGRRLIRLVTVNPFQCVNTDTIFLIFRDCTAIGELPEEEVAIYPNPGDGLFTLEVTTREAVSLLVTLTNMLDMELLRYEDPAISRYRNKTINLTFLPDGVYLLSLTTARSTTTHKLIIRK